MIEASNPHARNLKVISIAYILHWWLELGPSESGELNLTFISYQIHNTAPLPLISFLFLLYFFWRFYLTLNGELKKTFLWRLTVQFPQETRLEKSFFKELQSIESSVKDSVPSARNFTHHVSRYRFIDPNDNSLKYPCVSVHVGYNHDKGAHKAQESINYDARIKNLVLNKKFHLLRLILKHWIKVSYSHIFKHEGSPEVIIPIALAFFAFILALGNLFECYIAIPIVEGLLNKMTV